MRKSLVFLSALICCFTLFLPNAVAYANSALMTYDGDSEHFEMLAVKDEDISVESEELTFDFSGAELVNNSYRGVTTAVYDMRNAGDTKTVDMGFPLVSTIDAFNSDGTVIKMNGQVIEYTKYYAFAEGSEIVNLTFEEILDGLNQMETVDETLTGTLYTIDLADVGEEELVQVEFDINYDESFLIYNNFSGYTNEDEATGEIYQHIDLEAWTSLSGIGEESTVLSLYVIGDGLRNFEVKQLSRERVEGDSYDVGVVSTDTVTVHDYIYTLREDIDDSVYKISATKFLQYLESGTDVITKSDVVSDIFETQCLVFLGYTVSLEGNNAANILSVSYPFDGGYSAYYEPTMYTYNYVSSPAKNWASFGTLTINIITNENTPYIHNANLEYTQISEYSYQYTGVGVPKGNIEFSLNASEDPDYEEDNGTRTGIAFWLQFAFYGIIGLSVAGIIVSLTIIIVRKRKLKNGENK